MVWRDSSDSALEREGPAPESSSRRGDGLSQRPELQKGGVLRGTRPGLPRLANWEGVTGNQNPLWVWCSGPRLPAAPLPSSAHCGWLFPRARRLLSAGCQILSWNAKNALQERAACAPAAA